MAAICTCCGQTIRAKAVKRSALPERAELDAQFASKVLTQAQYFAQCKRIGLRDDLRFFLRVVAGDCPIDLYSEGSLLLVQLETRAATTADAKAINSLRDRYRIAKGSLVVYASAPVTGRKRKAA